MESFGKRYEKIRIQKGYSLREFCRNFGLDPSNLSKIERSVLPPPQGEVLDKYLSFVDISKKSDLWFEMRDLASIARGEIPKDLTDKELLEKMPIFFRIARNVKNKSGKEAAQIIKGIIKNAWKP